MPKFNEREFIEKGFSLATVSLLRDIVTFVGEEVTTITLSDLQSLILQINAKAALISQLEQKIIEVEKIAALTQRNNSDLQMKIIDLEKRIFTREEKTDYGQRIADLERMIM